MQLADLLVGHFRNLHLLGAVLPQIHRPPHSLLVLVLPEQHVLNDRRGQAFRFRLLLKL